MKKIFFSILIAFSINMITVSCNRVENDLQRMSTLVRDAEQNGDTYSLEDWNDFIELYDAYQESLLHRQDKWTDEDFRRFGKITARYHKVLLTCGLDILKQGMSAGANIMKGYAEEMSGDYLEEVSDDYEVVLDDMVDEIEEIFEY